MSILSTIKADQLAARKVKNSTEATLLTTLIGEASMPGKNDGNRESTDQEVYSVIRKFIKNAQDTIAIVGGDSGSGKELTNEINILTRYLPHQMSESELRIAIENIADSVGATSPKDMGKVMKQLQASFAGTYDGKMASSLVGVILEARKA